MKPTLLIMAAGMGNRYGGLKQIDPVGPNGEIIIDYSVYDALRAGFGKIVFVIRRDFEEAFREHIGSKFEGQVEIQYAFQDLQAHTGDYAVPDTRERPWGTGHAMLVAREVINEPFVVINADDYYGPTAFHIIAEHLQDVEQRENGDYAMVGYTLRNTLSDYGTVSRGVCTCDGDGHLKTVTERTKIARDGDGATFIDPNGDQHPLTGDETVSMNFWGFKPTVFEHFERQFAEFLQKRGHEERSEFYIPSAVDELVENGITRVKVLKTPDSWFGVTYKEDKENAMRSIEALIEKGLYPRELWVHTETPR